MMDPRYLSTMENMRMGSKGYFEQNLLAHSANLSANLVAQNLCTTSRNKEYPIEHHIHQANQPHQPHQSHHTHQIIQTHQSISASHLSTPLVENPHAVAPLDLESKPPILLNIGQRHEHEMDTSLEKFTENGPKKKKKKGVNSRKAAEDMEMDAAILANDDEAMKNIIRRNKMVIRGQGREFVSRVHNYFLLEKANKKPLISTQKAILRTAQALGIGPSSVTRVLKEEKKSIEVYGKPMFKTPGIKRKKKKRGTSKAGRKPKNPNGAVPGIPGMPGMQGQPGPSRPKHVSDAPKKPRKPSSKKKKKKDFEPIMCPPIIPPLATTRVLAKAIKHYQNPATATAPVQGSSTLSTHANTNQQRNTNQQQRNVIATVAPEMLPIQQLPITQQVSSAVMPPHMNIMNAYTTSTSNASNSGSSHMQHNTDVPPWWMSTMHYPGQ